MFFSMYSPRVILFVYVLYLLAFCHTLCYFLLFCCFVVVVVVVVAAAAAVAAAVVVVVVVVVVGEWRESPSVIDLYGAATRGHRDFYKAMESDGRILTVSLKSVFVTWVANNNNNNNNNNNSNNNNNNNNNSKFAVTFFMLIILFAFSVSIAYFFLRRFFVGGLDVCRIPGTGGVEDRDVSETTWRWGCRDFYTLVDA